MIKSLIASTAVRKAVIFSLVFVMAGVFMGVPLARTPGVHVVPSDGFTAAARVSIPHDERDVVRPEALTHGQSPGLEELLQPMSAGLDRRDYVVFRERVLPSSPDPDPGDADPNPDEQGERNAPEPEQDAGFIHLAQLPLSEELQRYTWQRCQEQDISYTMVLALMWRESRFEFQAVNLNYNGTRDSGIMQINDVNKAWLHRELAIDNLLDPYQNIDAGTEILGRFVERYGEHGALLAYQYGEAGMRRKLAQGITTNRQIEQLYEKRAEYQAMLDGAAQ